MSEAKFFVHPTSIIDEDVEIGEDTKVWHFCHIQTGAKIGKNVRIQGSTKIWQPWKLIILDNSWIDGGVSLYSVNDIIIGSNVVVSESAFICTASHDIHSPVFELITKPIFIQNFAWICSRATVLMGVTIGEGSVVAACAVVTKNTEPWTVVGGNPAKVIGSRK